jgi:hypothetical protein
MNMGTLSLHVFNELFPDEVSARAWFERARWPDGPFHWNRKADACLERMALLIRNGIERPLPYAILTARPA